MQQLDERALNFIKTAKEKGWPKEEVRRFLASKGYDVGIAQPEPVAQPYVYPQDKYSGADKAKYMTRAAIEGATLGLGDIVAGGTNVLASDLAQVTHGQSFGDRVKAAGRLLTTLNPVNAPISAIQTLRRPEFKEGRREFVTEQEEFAKSHPYMNIGGELIGGILTSGLGGGGKAIASQAGKQGIKALAKEGARQGAIYGGLYGAGSGLTEEADKLSVENALKGGASGLVGGAVLGAALPVATVGGTRAAQAFLGTRGYAQRAANEIIQESGGKEIGQIVRNYKGTRALKEAIKADDNVALAVKEIADKEIVNSARKTKELVNQTLGVADVEKELADARKLYDQVINQSDVRVPKEFYNNLGTQTALKEALSKDYHNDLAGKGLDSLAVAQKTKEKLNGMIEAAKQAGDKGDVQSLTAVTKEFTDKLDAIAPGYKQARETYSKVIRPYNVIKDFTKIEGRERANSIKSLLTEENKEALTNAFGKEKADKFLKEMRDQSIENERFNKLYNAAETKLIKEQPQAQGRIREALESAGSIVGNAIDVARFGGARRGRRQIGEILLGIEKERNTPSISKIIANKIKEKGGYAMKPLDKTVNSLGEPVAKTEEGVKNFNKWFNGSKVVDEKGNPLVVYHGTNENFNAFDTSRIGSNTGNKGHYGTGFYATDKPEFAKQFGENVMPIYLKANKVFRGTPGQIKEVAKEMGVDAYERYAYAPKRLKSTIELTTNEIYGDNPEPFTKALKKLGYDAVYDEGEYVVFNPNKIKSVKNKGTFDPKNPNIYKSLIGGLGISQILKNKEGK